MADLCWDLWNILRLIFRRLPQHLRGLINLASAMNIIGNINASANTVSNNMLVTGSLVTGASNEFNQRAFTTTTSGLTPVMLDSFVGSSYQMGKYIFYVKDLVNNNFYSSESMILYNGSSAAMNEFGAITSNSVVGIFSSNVSAGVVQIIFVPALASLQIRVYRALFTS